MAVVSLVGRSVMKQVSTGGSSGQISGLVSRMVSLNGRSQLISLGSIGLSNVVSVLTKDSNGVFCELSVTQVAGSILVKSESDMTGFVVVIVGVAIEA